MISLSSSRTAASSGCKGTMGNCCETGSSYRTLSIPFLAKCAFVRWRALGHVRGHARGRKPKAHIPRHSIRAMTCAALVAAHRSTNETA